jgi:hypothetical protein
MRSPAVTSAWRGFGVSGLVHGPGSPGGELTPNQFSVEIGHDLARSQVLRAPLGPGAGPAPRAAGAGRCAIHGRVSRLVEAFGGSPKTWLKLQMQYDLAQALKHEAALKVRRVTSPAA